MKKSGYHTAAFIGAVILDSKTLAPGLDRGFDFYDNFPAHSQTKSRWGRVERRGADVVQHAQTWMTAHPAGPHFVWIHLYDPHDPYEPPPPFSQTYKDRLYDGEIAYADSVLAGFIGYLKKTGRYDNALIVVVGDHGEGSGRTRRRFARNFSLRLHHPRAAHRKNASEGYFQAYGDQVVEGTGAHHWISCPPLPSGCRSRHQSIWTESLLNHFWMVGEEKIVSRLARLTIRCASVGRHCDLFGGRVQVHRGASSGVVRSKSRSKRRPITTSRQTRRCRSFGDAGRDQERRTCAASNLPDPKDKIEEQNLLHTAMMASDDNRTDEARRALEKVLQLDAKSPTALRQLGELELQAGDFAKAAEHLKQAREVRPEDSTAAFYEGQARQKTGDFAGARDALEASLKLTPGQFPARLLLGQVYLSLKDARNAEDQFEAALLIDPKNADAQKGLVEAQKLQKSER